MLGIRTNGDECVAGDRRAIAEIRALVRSSRISGLLRSNASHSRYI